MALSDFLRRNKTSGKARFYMPGHKGLYPLDAGCDITEIDGADSLYHANGVIRETERRLSAIYGSSETVLSAGGTTLCIQGMLAAAKEKWGIKKILAARNAHIAFVNACVLLDIDPVWVYPKPYDRFGVSGQVTPDELDASLKGESGVGAVYITSPDYFGMLTDIGALAAVCEKHKVPLLVDNAHGAHLLLLDGVKHPLAQGAAMCADGAHKTLPVLTGGALLHTAGGFSAEELKSAMALFGSTSPSYLIMQSLDKLADYLSGDAKADFARLIKRLDKIKENAGKRGLFVFDSEPARISLGGVPKNFNGTLSDFLRARQIECDYAAGDTAVLLPSPFNSAHEFSLLEEAIEAFVPAEGSVKRTVFPVLKPQRVLSPREAVLSGGRVCPVGKLEDRIAAETKITCPPGVAIVVAGERINGESQKLLENSGIFALKVV